MKKAFLVVSTIVLSFVLLNLSVTKGHTDEEGAEFGYTGSPLEYDGRTCNDSTCHNNFPVIVEPGHILSNIPPTGYIPGQVYQITGKIADPDSNAVKFGFQMSPQRTNAAKAGVMAVTDAVRMKLIGGSKYVTHKLTGTGNNGFHNNFWTVNWTAPAAGTGQVTIYGAFNVTNNDADPDGDVIYNSSLTVQEGTVGIAEDAVLAGISLFPNPNNGNFSLLINKNTTVKTLVFSAEGKLVYNETHQNQSGTQQKVNINLQNKLQAGVYMMAIEAGDARKVVKFVVQ